MILGDAKVIRSKVWVARGFEQAIALDGDCTISFRPGGAVVCSTEHDISLLWGARLSAIPKLLARAEPRRLPCMLRRHRLQSPKMAMVVTYRTLSPDHLKTGTVNSGTPDVDIGRLVTSVSLGAKFPTIFRARP
jgi:hypothetical protein